MSDINPDGISGNNGTSGKWPLTVDKLSGMIRHNCAIGSGGICPSLDHGGNVKTAILSTPWDVDLVTVEAGLNDWGQLPLGDFGDTNDDTFIGNFTQCIQYLVSHTRAKIVLITMPNRTYTSREQTERYNPLLVSSYGYSYRDLLDLEIAVCQAYGVEVIDTAAGVPYNFRNKKTVKDFVHFTDLGGKIYGEYIWGKLKAMQPSNTSFTQEDYV
jgi:lysophospholipase L1-like esterase